jgi:hypothetical protein
MIKTLFIGVWACLITLAASYETTSLMRARAARPTLAALGAVETRKSKEMNVPIIRDGMVKGYVVAQFSYVVDLAVANTLPIPPDAVFVDEAFRYIYDDDKVDFPHLEKIELGKLAATVMQKVNERMKARVIADVGVVECTYLLNTEAKSKL